MKPDTMTGIAANKDEPRMSLFLIFIDDFLLPYQEVGDILLNGENCDGYHFAHRQSPG
jgi:hypothetical protein